MKESLEGELTVWEQEGGRKVSDNDRAHRMKEMLEGDLQLEEQEAGHCDSAILIGGISLSTKIEQWFGFAHGVDETAEGKYRITVERIE